MAPIPKISPRHFRQTVQTQMLLLQPQLPSTYKTGPRQHQIRQRPPPYSPTLHHDFKLMDKFSLSVKKVSKLCVALKFLGIRALLKPPAANGEQEVAVKRCGVGCYPPQGCVKKERADITAGPLEGLGFMQIRILQFSIEMCVKNVSSFLRSS